MQGLALVDYDNLRLGLPSSTGDVALQAGQMLRLLARAFLSLFAGLQELDVRFYGGWTDERGLPSRAALGLLPILAELRGRRHGIIVRPSLALTMMEFPDLLLRGTVRSLSGKQRQKMVDGMLGCDAVFAARDGETNVGVVTDDDDLIPSLLTAHSIAAASTLLVRRRRVGTALNDVALSSRAEYAFTVSKRSTMDSTDFFEYWRDRIEHDLASFSDPGSRVTVTGTPRRLNAAWTMKGSSRDAVFSISTAQGVAVQLNGRKADYRGFIADAGMADLRYVARMILNASRPQIFVSTNANRPDVEPSTSRPAIDVLTELLEDPEGTGATQVVMVTGAAGAGKTRVFQQLVRRQADEYLRGQTDKLLLYVNAQGRALARLNEALATELQDLRVGLTYHSIAVLARLGLLVPVIDGFDELIGVSGYDDAFSSLAGFLEQLDGEGQVLASARSVYYEEEFLTRAGGASASSGQAWRHVPVSMSEWSDDARNEYLDLRIEQEGLDATAAEELRSRVQAVFEGPNSGLWSKPLFLARTVDILLRDPTFTAGDDLLRELIRRLIERERKEKLLDRRSRSLLTLEQLEHLMCELALEMWNQESREIDYASVRFVAEVVMDESVSDSARQVVVERMPTLACLAPSDNRPGIAFEHEVFFFYFLAEILTSQLLSKDADLRVILSRSALADDVADRVGKMARASGRLETMEDLQQLLDRLARASAAEWRRMAQVQENAGLVTMALLRNCGGVNGDEKEIVDRSIRSVVFPGGRLDGVTLRRCHLSDLTVRRTDLVSTRFVECEARNVMLVEPRVKRDSTRLELRGFTTDQTAGLRLLENGTTETRYAPEEVAEILAACGAPIGDVGGGGGRQVNPEFVALLERLMRAYARANPVCVDDGTMKGLFRHPRWPELKRLLVKNHIVKEERRSTSGRPTTFLRRQFLPNQVMAGLREESDTDSRIRTFWREVEAAGGGAEREHAGEA